MLDARSLRGGRGVRGCPQYGMRWQGASASGFQAGGSVRKSMHLAVCVWWGFSDVCYEVVQ